MRERRVSCRLFECRAMTWRDDGFCSDAHAELFRSRCARTSAGARVGGRVSARPVPIFSPAGAYSSHGKPPAGDHP